MHNSIGHTENGFWCVPAVAVADREKHSDQSATIPVKSFEAKQ